eukprot:1077116_1
MPSAGNNDDLLSKGRQLFNGVYKEKFLDSLRDSLGFWDRLKLEGGLSLYGDKFMPQIATHFGEAYQQNHGKIIETLDDLKKTATDFMKQKGLTDYEKPAESAIDELIDEETKRQNARIEYINIAHQITQYSSARNMFDNGYPIHLHHEEHTNKDIFIESVIGFEWILFAFCLVMLTVLCIAVLCFVSYCVGKPTDATRKRSASQSIVP